MKKTLLILLCIILSLSAVLTGCMFPPPSGSAGQHNGSQSPQSYESVSLYDFSADTEFVGENSVSNVSFSVTAAGMPTAVYLYAGEELITEMLDDGENTDTIAGDGIYTAYVSITTVGPETLQYNASAADGAVSEYDYIEVLPLPSSADAADVSYVLDTLAAFTDTYSDSPALQMHNAISKIKKFKNEGRILSYDQTEDSIEFVHYSGLRCCFVPYIPDTLGVGDDGSYITVLTAEPHMSQFDETMFTDGYHYYKCGGYTEELALRLRTAFRNYSAPANLDFDEKEVTLDTISKFGKNQLVLWLGHGGFLRNGGPCIMLREEFDENRYQTDADYYNMLVNGELITSTDGEIGFTAKYVYKNIGDLTGSFFFFNSCFSGKSSELADAFLDKGAYCFIGYTSSVYVHYAGAMQFSIITRMANINPATNEYYSLSEAIEAGKKDYGYNDSIPGADKTPAEIIVFGGERAENLRLSTTGKQQTPPSTTQPRPETSAPKDTEPATNTYTNADAHNAYRELLKNHGWIPYCPSDLSEIPKEEYNSYALGSYYVCDIDDNGIDELIIKAGQSIADTSMTFFTYDGKNIIYSGSLETGSAWLYERTDTTGAVICEHQGGSGVDTYINLKNNVIVTERTESYNYERPGYIDNKAGITKAVDVFSVHDLSGL